MIKLGDFKTDNEDQKARERQLKKQKTEKLNDKQAAEDFKLDAQRYKQINYNWKRYEISE